MTGRHLWEARTRLGGSDSAWWRSVSSCCLCCLPRSSTRVCRTLHRPAHSTAGRPATIAVDTSSRGRVFVRFIQWCSLMDPVADIRGWCLMVARRQAAGLSTATAFVDARSPSPSPRRFTALSSRSVIAIKVRAASPRHANGRASSSSQTLGFTGKNHFALSRAFTSRSHATSFTDNTTLSLT